MVKWCLTRQPGQFPALVLQPLAQQATPLATNTQPFTSSCPARRPPPRRYHHLHCDTPLDLHSPYEGFFHAHMGWLFRAADVERPLLDRSNVKDLAQHAFYRWLEHTWVAHMLGRFFFTWVRCKGQCVEYKQMHACHHAIDCVWGRCGGCTRGAGSRRWQAGGTQGLVGSRGSSRSGGIM